MKILITGGTGFLGSALCKLALVHHNVYVLTRNKKKAIKMLPSSVQVLSKEDEFPKKIDAIFNFAGSAISAKILNTKRIEELLKSRLQVLELLAKKYPTNALPKYFIQASATGIYSNFQTCAENGKCYGFFFDLINTLEEASSKYFAKCSHYSVLRFGVILGSGGGLFKILKYMPRLRIIPDKKNYVPWVSIDDATKVCLFLLDHPLDGIINVSNPSFLTANELLYNVKKTKFFLPLPLFLLEHSFDKRGLLLTASHCISSKRLLDQGFVFSKPQYL